MSNTANATKLAKTDLRNAMIGAVHWRLSEAGARTYAVSAGIEGEQLAVYLAAYMRELGKFRRFL